jgi:hypothetical protein
MRMRRSTVALAISLALAGPVHPQASNTTTGACSPIVSQNSGPVTIECSGISEDVQRQLTEVLNSILQKQLDPAAVMSKLDEIAKGVGDLKEKAFDAERGILTTYEFNGAKREQAGGQHILTVGGELTDDFQKMQEMTTSKQWPALAALCERHITGTPKWLAPYYFAGVAYTMMGNKAKALSRLEHVAKYAQSDPRLTEVSNKTGILLDRLKAQP